MELLIILSHATVFVGGGTVGGDDSGRGGGGCRLLHVLFDFGYHGAENQC